ncbi:MAG: hypothetical protein K2K27_02555 [Muribaculaceae bacterium]|nr:hypothetical protein [Muribaculaceae bacterium]
MSNLLKYISVAIFLGSTLWSCSDDRYIIDPNGDPIASRSSVRAQIAGNHEIGDEMLYNIRPYIFNGEDNSTRGNFYGIPNSVIFPGHYIDMSMRPGTWDITLVTSPTSFYRNPTLLQSTPGVEDLQDVLEQPSHGANSARARMYRHRGVNNVLPDFKDFYTAIVKGVEVKNDPEGYVNEYESPIYFLRNYCKVRVILDWGQELKEEANAQKVWLSNIPEALTWQGGLYPNAQNPDVSPYPMETKAWDVRYKCQSEPDGEGNTKPVIESANELIYYIPAHRGEDADTDQPVDTALHKININFALTALDGTPVSKTDVPVNLTPRPNTELVLKVKYEKRQLAVFADIIPWVEENAKDASLGARHVKVDKAEIGLAWKDTLHVDCDVDFTVAKAASCAWLTVNKLNDHDYELVANTDTYVPGTPRTSYVEVITGNYTKRINVTQRPERGTIKAHLTGSTDKTFWLSPVHNTKNVTVECVGGDWKTLESTALDRSYTGPAGVTDNIPVTRKPDVDIFFDEFDQAYGLQPVIFMNKKTLDTDTVFVDNLFIGADDDVLEIEQPTSGTLQVVTSHIAVYGGNQDVQIISYPSFIQSVTYDIRTHQFTFLSKSNANGDDQWGDIVVGHKSDPDYRVSIPIDQSIRVDIPEFDYFVIKFTWGSADVDIQCGFYGNATSVNYRDVVYPTTLSNTINGSYVGWSRANNSAYLKWGGDATGGQGETVFFNAKQINAIPYPGGRDASGKRVTPSTPNMLPRVVTFVCGAGWYSGSGYCTCTITCYLGGTMNQSGTNFNNSGGSVVYTASNGSNLTNSKPQNSKYTKMCIIEYDRKKHTASVSWDLVNFM